MIKSKTFLFLITFCIILVASGCAASDPADAVKAYWQAIIAKDDARVSSLSCAAYEPEALTTLESFRTVEAKLNDLACTSGKISGDTAAVTCTGSIVASYGAENLSIDLAERAYTAKKEAGDWRMCGMQ
jgi:hypothetical protein